MTKAEKVLPSFCPQCHQPLINVIGGVKLPRFKAKLFRYIDTRPGTSCADLAHALYTTPDIKNPVQAIRSHISQLNSMLAHTDTKIVGEAWKGYRVVRGKHANG